MGQTRGALARERVDAPHELPARRGRALVPWHGTGLLRGPGGRLHAHCCEVAHGPGQELRSIVGAQWELRPVLAPGDQCFSSALALGARARRPTSAGDSEILLNKIEAVIQQKEALLRPLCSCRFYAPQAPGNSHCAPPRQCESEVANLAVRRARPQRPPDGGTSTPSFTSHTAKVYVPNHFVMRFNIPSRPRDANRTPSIRYPQGFSFEIFTGRMAASANTAASNPMPAAIASDRGSRPAGDVFFSASHVKSAYRSPPPTAVSILRNSGISIRKKIACLPKDGAVGEESAKKSRFT